MDAVRLLNERGFQADGRSFIVPGAAGGGIRLRLVSSSGEAPHLVGTPFGDAVPIFGGLGGGHLVNFGQQMTYEDLLELQERMGYEDRGASADQINDLPTRTFKRRRGRGGADEAEASSSKGGAGPVGGGESSLSSDQTTCSICLEDYSHGQEIRTLPCCHSFHAQCVDKWLAKNRSCPVCKKDIC